MSTVLVVGASSGIGLATVKRALDAGHEVRALARSAASIALEHPSLRKIPGDALDAAAVKGAVAGADVVIEALGLRPGKAYLIGTTLFSTATRVLVDAMQASGVRRLIAVTGLGAGDSRGRGGLLYDTLMFPLVLKRIYDDKDIQEMIIRRSSLDWTIVRPGLLDDGPATGRYRVLLDPKDWRAGPIARADVADFLVKQITDVSMLGKTPLLIR